MFAVWLALLPRIVRSVYNYGLHDMETWKEYVDRAQLDGASTLEYSPGSRSCPRHASGLVTEITARCRWRSSILPRWASSTSARNLSSGGRCSTTRFRLIYVAPRGTLMLPGAPL